MPKGKGYDSFEETFGSPDDQPHDSSSSENMWDMSVKAKSDAKRLRSMGLGNAAQGPRSFGR